ncbi:DUF945 family protein [Vibrio ostreae]|uniref:DUF945 family protein n=1 Tax=Vibrio ostreae TaxID=2841925 RepID=A0A975UBV6_9VIBR|nr:DUF945 family protein [Vibrio ostreae]QXO19003.1 DUF945 family protein [Vibrio ostreae]
MNTIKRIGAVGGAVVLVLCWPLAVGQIGQNVITDGIAHFSNEQVTAELVSYDRGYLSSHVETRYTILDPQLKAQLAEQGIPAQFLLDSEISHGLISLTAVSDFPEYPELPLTITSTTSLNGNTRFKVESDNWHYQNQGETPFTISLTPAVLEGSATRLGELTYSLSVPSIDMDFTNGEKAQLSHLRIDGQGKQIKGFWIGKQSLTLDALTTTDIDGTTPFSADKASYQFTSTLDEATQRFSSQHVVNIGQVVNQDNILRDVQLDFTLADVDSDSFEQLSNIYQSYPEMTHEAMGQAMPYLDTLFSKGFRLTMDKLSASLGEGEFTSSWSLSIPEGTDNVMQDPGIVLSALTGHLESSVSNQLAAAYPMIQQGADELVVMEMATQDDKGYQLKADVKDGNLQFANGTKVPLMALFMTLMMQQG